jgi:hypothetical protein
VRGYQELPAPLEISTARVRQAAWPYVYAFSPPGATVRICRCVIAKQSGLGHVLQAEMKTKCLVEFGDESRWQLAYPGANPLDRYRADLLGLCFGVLGQSCLACG